MAAAFAAHAGYEIIIVQKPDNDQYYMDRACAHSMLENYAAARIDRVSPVRINPGNTLANEHLKIFNELLEGKIDGIEVKRKTWDSYYFDGWFA